MDDKPLPDAKLVQVGLGLRLCHVEQMTGVVKDKAVRLDAAARSTRLALPLEHHRRDAGPFKPLGSHETGEASTDDKSFHHESIGTNASHRRRPATTVATTPVKTSVDTGSRNKTTRPRAPKITATA